MSDSSSASGSRPGLSDSSSPQGGSRPGLSDSSSPQGGSRPGLSDSSSPQGGSRPGLSDDYPPVLDAAQVARLLNLNIDYVRKLSREGVLPAKRLPGGRTFRYFKDEILDWLRAQDVAPAGEQAEGARAAADRRGGAAG